MRSSHASIVLFAALAFAGAACGSGDGDGQEAFELTGRVVSVEPGAQPANVPSGTDISGALLVQGAAPEGCDTDTDDVRIYVGDDTSITPTSASGDLEQLEGETVSVGGTVSTDGDACTPIATSVLTQGGAGSSPSGTAEPASGTTGGASTPKATSSSKASASNDPDDEGRIGDTEETASPAPENPDEHGVMNDDGER